MGTRYGVVVGRAGTVVDEDVEVDVAGAAVVSGAPVVSVVGATDVVDVPDSEGSDVSGTESIGDDGTATASASLG